MSSSSREPQPATPHKKRRRRFSPVRFSTDTSQTLPEYSSSSSHRSPRRSSIDTPSEEPPDYPASADEADSEFEEDKDTAFHPLPLPITPRRRAHFTSRRKNLYSSGKSAASDTFLDSLLERSVHALEMSNAILQSSLASPPLPREPFHDLPATSQSRYWSDERPMLHRRQPSWMDEMDEVSRNVDDLFSDVSRRPTQNAPGLSKSLPPSSSSELHRHHRRASLDKRREEQQSGLQLTTEDDILRNSRPPRPLTQYVAITSTAGDTLESTADHESIFLPSTIGVRTPSVRSDFSPTTGRQSGSRTTPIPFSSRRNTDPTPVTPAYSLLSNIVTRVPSRSDSPSSSFMTPRASRSSLSESTQSTPRGRLLGSRTHSSPDSFRSHLSGSPHRWTEPRAMTPPQEESTPSSSPSSLEAPRTMESLRKILQDSPVKEPELKRATRPPPITIIPRSTPSEPQTFSTTASVSRLLTRATHTLSTKAQQPTHSSLKGGSSPTVRSAALAESPSVSSSGRSTPRQVAFAQLPESYSGSRGGSKLKPKSKAKKKKSKDEGGWWTSLLTNLAAAPPGPGMGRFEDKIEERSARGWGRPPISGGSVEDWTL